MLFSQERVGEAFGVSKRTDQDWAGGAINVPPAVEILAKLMAKHDLDDL